MNKYKILVDVRNEIILNVFLGNFYVLDKNVYYFYIVVFF